MTPKRIPTLTELADTYDLEAAASQAEVLSPVSAGLLEEVLVHNPLDLVNRARLLGFYYRYRSRTRAAFTKDYRARRTQHIKWFIENAPDCVFAGNLYLALNKIRDKENYSSISLAWEIAVERAPSNSQIKINAVLFCLKDEKRRSLALLESVRISDSANPWVAALHLYLGPEADASHRYQIDPDALSTAGSDDLRELCSGSILHNAFYAGRYISRISAETCKRVLKVFPDDVSARAELLAFYSARCLRFNILGHDPACERGFVSHALWFIRHMLGADSLSQLPVPELTSSARTLLLSALKEQQTSKAQVDIKRCIVELKRSIMEKTEEEKRELAARLRKGGRKPNCEGALDQIAIVPPKLNLSSVTVPLERNLTEWANDCFMDRGQLTGSYRWMAPHSSEHLDQIIDDDDIDMYNRAKIIGFYRQSQNAPDGDESKRFFLKHLHWLISNVPDCDFLRGFYWPGLVADSDTAQYIYKLWLEVATSHNSAGTFINAALAHFTHDKATARALLESALNLDSTNLLAKDLLRKMELKDKPSDGEMLMMNHRFVAGRKSNTILAAASRVDLYLAWFLGLHLPVRAVGTEEQLVLNNPNELVLRAELMSYYSNRRYCFSLEAQDPKYSLAHLNHTLWFIEHAPDLERLIPDGDYHSDPVGFAVRLDAWKQQLKAYPKSARIAGNASWIFSRDRKYFLEGIAMLKLAVKRNPSNKMLKRRLREMKELEGFTMP